MVDGSQTKNVMEKREDLYKLIDIVEFNEGHFEVATSQSKTR